MTMTRKKLEHAIGVVTDAGLHPVAVPGRNQGLKRRGMEVVLHRDGQEVLALGGITRRRTPAIGRAIRRVAAVVALRHETPR